jgi:PAB-dependent poly(A)-specific ribonuclease subunit 2
MLNAAIASSDAKQFWATPGWLPEEIGVIIDQGQFFCYQGDDLKLHLQRGIHNITVFSLMGLCADIDSGQHQKSHLVSLVNGMLQSTPACANSNFHSGTLSTHRTIRKPVASVQ